GSVKSLPLAEVSDHVPPRDLSRYVGGHPMAGSERSGPLAASAELFGGRPWAITPDVHADPDAVRVVEHLASLCGALPVRLSPVEHDRAVARTSHVPHLLAVLTAAQLRDAVPEHLTLSGQGVRDVTRVAAGDPDLYGQIIRANGPAVVELLNGVRADLADLIEAIEAPDAEPLTDVLQRGVDGTRSIPAKHGGPVLDTTIVQVTVSDTPGELARLLREVGDIGVNIEDLRIDHDPGRATGLAELTVTAHSAEGLRDALTARGWVTHR
ncbi:MAG: prephenate dehydrogenase/arogenate dehydrogenase family protein, partial [Myxococcales bacterium]